MRFRIWRAAAAATALAAAVALSGCAADDPEPAPSPSPSSSPLFATDEEALAAAEEAYARYVAAVDLSLQTGGADISALANAAEGSALSRAEVDASEFAEAGLRTVGPTKINNIQLQSADSGTPEGVPSIFVYVCEDVSEVDLLDAAGTSVVSPERTELTPFEVQIVRSDVSGMWKVAERALWDGASICV